MRAFNVANVDEALPLLLQYIYAEGRETTSRNGPVLTIDTPVGVTYRSPKQRFVLSQNRKQNPFFLVMEALWIMSGRNDVNWLCRFNENMRQYSDDGETFHGAYGKRLGDQLGRVILHLLENPDSRRAVAQIWSRELDLGTRSADLPCNMLLVFAIRDGRLFLTVYNRSNDLVWGMCNANAVQFSVIQEYVAAGLGLPTGEYTQVTNNLHLYTEMEGLDRYRRLPLYQDHDYRHLKTVPLVYNFDVWDQELDLFMDYSSKGNALIAKEWFSEPYFKDVAIPLYNVWMSRKYMKGGQEQQQMFCNQIKDEPTKLLTENWIR